MDGLCEKEPECQENEILEGHICNCKNNYWRNNGICEQEP